MDFGEKQKEYSPKHGKELPVWQSPKYQESKAKAEEIINSGKYNVTSADFWILMNATKSEKMAYTGLIISHNGCLKINDCLASKFDPSCVTIDKDGYKNSLVYSYCNADQGIYEVGEVSPSNCKNEYPYAMAFKRLFDRVVLKLSKLAYAGIYSDSEADEFTQRIDEPTEKPEKQNATDKKPAIPDKKQEETKFMCEECTLEIKPTKNKDGSIWKPADVAAYSKRRFGRQLCPACQKKAFDAEKEGKA